MPGQPIKKKIAYTLTVYDAAHSGVYRKILDQVTFWRSAGYVVQLFVITDYKSVTYWQEIDSSAVILIDSNRLARFTNRFKLMKMAIEFEPWIIYLRDSFPIRVPKSKIPVVIEIQSLVGQEVKARSRIKFLSFVILKRFLYAQISGAVYVTHELMEINEFGLRNRISKITIGNAINFKRIEPLSPRREHQLALFFVGTPNQPWHGVSELIEFGRKNPEINIHIVGERGIEKLPNIFFYGKLNPIEYRSVADKCVAGVGSLNLVVNHMKEASPLKVREYLALGLPVILKYKDTDLDPTEPYVLQLPSDGRPLSEFTMEIKMFLDEWSTKRVTREEIANLDIEIKEMNRLEFFEDVRMNIPNEDKPRG